MRYTNIIFDIDGTLLDTRKTVILSWQEALKDFGFNMSEEELNFVLGIPGTSTFDKLGIKDHAAALARLEETYKNYNQYSSIFPGIKQVVADLKAKGISIGIVTSRNRREYAEAFPQFGIADYFNPVICVEDTLKHKPHGEPMLKYLELTSAPAAKSLYIGDTTYDRDCARSAGVDFGLALWGAIDKSIASEHYFAEPADILKVL